MAATRRKRPSSPRIVLILAAYPKRRAATRAAKLLLEERVLACATVVPGARAVYFWNGKRHSDSSTLLYGKTTAARVKDALRRIRESHPDQVPEILVLNVMDGDPAYLSWVGKSVAKK